MARFCPECGAQLEDGARFCAECGAQLNDAAAPQPEASQGAVPQPEAPQDAAPQREAPQPEAPQGAAPQPEAPQWQAAAGGAAPTPPKPKKPLPKWALPTGIAVAAVVVVLVALSLILGSVNSPESVSEKFLKAMDAGDFAALSKVAVLADEEQTLTAEAAQPFFDLYASDIAFRMQLEELLDEDEERIDDGRDPNEGYLVDLRAQSGFLHTAYKVVLETCDMVSISSNLVCEASLSGGQTVTLTADSDPEAASDADAAVSADAGLAQWSMGTLYDVLPGAYTVSATVTTSAGDTFTAETQLTVDNEFNADCELYFDYVSVDVDNDSDVPVELYVNGGTTPFLTMEAHSYGMLAPLTPDATVEARADMGGDEPMTETFTAEEGYIYLSFQLCDLEVYNSYYAPLYIYDQDGGLLGELTAEDYYVTIEDLYPGTEVTIQMYDQEGLVDPVTVTITGEDTYESIDPEFTGLSASATTEALTAISTYVDEVLTYYNAGDRTGLMTLPVTDFSDDLDYELESDQEENGEGSMPDVSFVREGDVALYTDYDPYLGNYNGSGEEYNIPTARLYCVIPLNGAMMADDGSMVEESNDVRYEFEVQYIDGAWTITG